MAFVAPIIAAVQTVAPVLSAVGTGLSVLGTLSSAKAQAQQSQSQAGISEYNARIAENNAIQARQAAESDAAQIRRDTKLRLSAIKGTQAASGIVTTEGSPLLVQQEQAVQGELEAMKRLYSGNLQTSAYTSQAVINRTQAQAYGMQPQSIMSNAYQTASGQLLTGVAGTSLLR